ncbi:MAG: hypothetical protein K0R12_1028 [Gammaproteobacteria bacterium]|nr:hypothetical protein [Gammaproteobacteria bacterium]
MSKPIFVNNISLSFPHKTCFEDFSIHIPSGSRIAVIGRNGSGKTTLLHMLQGEVKPTHGSIEYPENLIVGFVPQIIETLETTDVSIPKAFQAETRRPCSRAVPCIKEYRSSEASEQQSLSLKGKGYSGGERFNMAFTKALSLDPAVLLLDEPTNHLDAKNRRSLLRMLQAYTGTLIIASHDTELLRHCVDTLWHIDNAKITVFSGHYDNYIAEIQNRRASIEHDLLKLKRQKNALHQSLMQEQERAAKSRMKGEKNIEQRKWPTIVSKAKALRAEETSGNKKSALDHKKQALTEELASLRLPEIILPTFSINAADIPDKIILSVTQGEIAYNSSHLILQNTHLSLGAKGRMAITGNNGSGKSTLMKAIAGDNRIIKKGEWYLPKKEEIGYLDQHYSTLDLNKTVFDSVRELVPNWPYGKVRQHFTDFLFFNNEEINAYVYQLSGGEKARLILAQIAAKTPKLLLLDEITNNLDLQTKNHVIEVLKHYPGALLVISHDADFLKEINIEEYYRI